MSLTYNDSDDNIIVKFRTIQGSVIRNLFESVKEILTDVNINFLSDSIKCTAIDGNKIACVYFKLEADKFEVYTLNEPITAGINMQSLFKLIKTVTNNDTVSMIIYRNERYKLHIIVENSEKHTCTRSILKLLDIDQEIITIPNVEFDNIITMQCTDFQRYCKDMMTISNVVTMTCKNNVFALSCSGDFADQIIEIHECDSIVTKDGDEEISETFSLKYINLFVKSTSLCSIVEIYLKKDFPLILVYRIGSLGKIQFCLAPQDTSSH
ncbi:DNA polymerase sliding clamp 2 [Heterosigma akashiwo virus 01]|jgi:proliferating cell nuclear antigen|uniref:DNA polymerase sliding clamp 2 n=1 Tax=Heterosigma akashiwo virus 01 TaxID=97195 RepID=A0A1C9C4Y8_HAV01|nr:DNA polymerase sliding clamp 2 [Heterosigma akashiwo virus 01]AOM63351.1 DNA polymerase sliding clamp 2 [Heterosigma akashiwo virus 01]